MLWKLLVDLFDLSGRCWPNNEYFGMHKLLACCRTQIECAYILPFYFFFRSCGNGTVGTWSLMLSHGENLLSAFALKWNWFIWSCCVYALLLPAHADHIIFIIISVTFQHCNLLRIYAGQKGVVYACVLLILRLLCSSVFFSSLIFYFVIILLKLTEPNMHSKSIQIDPFRAQVMRVKCILWSSVSCRWYWQWHDGEMDLSVDESVINVLAHQTWKRIELLLRDLRTLIMIICWFFLPAPYLMSRLMHWHILNINNNNNDIKIIAMSSHSTIRFKMVYIGKKILSPQEHGLFH